MVGERVLVSREGSGANHEEATVWDYYELLINSDKRPMVVVDFDDGERKWIPAEEPNVIAIEPEDEEDPDEDDWDDDEDEGGESEAGDESEHDDPGSDSGDADPDDAEPDT